MYYNLIKTPDGYRMVKFDDLWNVDSVYNISYRRGHFFCDCMAGNKPDCRHRQMVPIFCKHRAVNSGKFYCFDTGEWHEAMEIANG